MGIDSHAENELIDIFLKHPLIPSRGADGRGALLLGRPTMIGTAHRTPESLFEALGAVGIDSLDVTPSEGANLIHDLNFPLPSEMSGRYSLVYDNGTLEHLFDVRQCMENIHDVLAVGGMVVHSNPVNNFVNHGFFQFSPCFYCAVYFSNGYEICQMSFTGVKKTFSPGRAPTYEVAFHRRFNSQQIAPFVSSPRVIIESASVPSVMVSVMIVARKLADSRFRVPQQPIYGDEFQKFGRASIISL